MKKIVSALALGAVAASLATADVKVNLNARLQNIDLYNQKEDAAGNKTTTTASLGNGSDTLKIAAKEDFGGAQLEIVPNTDGTIKTDKYWGWLTWGKFNLTGGNFDSRWMTRLNGAATEINTVDSNTSKFGISKTIAGLKSLTYKAESTDKDTKNITAAAVAASELDTTATGYGRSSSFGTDFDDVSAIGGTRVISLFADYTFEDLLPGSLLLKGGIYTSNFKTDEDDAEDKKYIKSGFLGQIAYNQADAVKADLVVSVPTEKMFGIGAYVQPLVLPEGLSLVFGGTFVNSSADNEWSYKLTKGSAVQSNPVTLMDGTTIYTENNGVETATNATLTQTLTFNKWSAWAADLQAQFKVNDQLNTIFQAKYTQLTLKDADDYDIDPFAALELAAEVAYKVNDTLIVALDGALYMNDLNDTDELKAGQNTFVILPNFAVTAGKNCRLSAGLKYTQALDIDEDDKADATKSTISVPVVLRVKF